MNIAILGGTHGNEFTGIEVINHLKKTQYSSPYHHYETFLANPKAYKNKSRYIDSDLNRAFAENSTPLGYEKNRSQELKELIHSKFDFLIDLHSTTSNMGLTVILTKNDLTSIKAASYMQEKYPNLKIICIEDYKVPSPYTINLCPSGLIIEVGPVAHNVKSFKFIKETTELLMSLLSWDFNSEVSLKRTYYKSFEHVEFPKMKDFYISPQIEQNMFPSLTKGSSLFENLEGDKILYQRQEESFAFFVNEASYQETNMAMTLAHKNFDLTNVLKA